MNECRYLCNEPCENYEELISPHRPICYRKKRELKEIYNKKITEDDIEWDTDMDDFFED
jgi:hypothetical protein